MKLMKFAAIAAAGMMTAAPALADLVIPTLNYRTGPYAPNGIPTADGFSDYLTYVNTQGGVGGEMLREVECETAYNTEKGVECYEALKGEGLIFIPQSTGITYQLIPKVTADGIPLMTPGYGRTSAKNGKIFEWVFNPPGTYWDVASALVTYVMDKEGGSLEGKKIALVYHNSAYGKEPIRTLEELSKKHNFELSTLAVDHPGQEQKSQWLQIRRERPDYVFMWGWGVMNQVAIQEAANIRFPMENFIGVWWSGSENDVTPAGDAATGYKSATWHAAGSDFPLIEAIQENVIDAGKAAGDGTKIGEVLYNRGVYIAAVLVEAIRTAQEMTGKSDITPADLRDGLENLNITEERWTEIGLPNFTSPVKLSCAVHSDPGLVAVQRWDAGTKAWSLVSDFIEPDREIIDALIAADSEAFASEAGITPRDC
ncbi:MAG: ABC transporter substrate-binding protein [Pseudomonadota bacterium]